MLPEDIATNNWNCRLSVTIAPGTHCPTISDYDPYIGANGQEKRSSTDPWNASTRTIEVTGGSQLTMGGGDYFVCRVLIKNGQLIMPANTEVRIFFDAPENCPNIEKGGVQLLVGGNATIISTAYKVGQTSKVPGFYLPGSSNVPSEVVLSGNSGGTNQLVIYGPNSEVTIDGSATWIGMIASDTLTLNGTPKIKADAGISPPAIAYAGIWEQTHYVECAGSVGFPAPDSNC